MCDNGCESVGDDGGDWEGDEGHPTVAFGRTFTHIPEHVRQDLRTLERECVVYTDHWIEEVGDFRHVRIDFTPEERKEFARRSWAYELFLREEPTWAAEVVGIENGTGVDGTASDRPVGSQRRPARLRHVSAMSHCGVVGSERCRVGIWERGECDSVVDRRDRRTGSGSSVDSGERGGWWPEREAMRCGKSTGGSKRF